MPKLGLGLGLNRLRKISTLIASIYVTSDNFIYVTSDNFIYVTKGS